jgi:HAD superfamily hydrolase (TIGR01509 family)
MPIPWNYRSVVFDLDGVLVDTEPVFEQAARRLLGRRNLTWVPEVAHRMMGTPAQQAFVFFREHYHLDEPIDDLIAESRVDLYELLGERPAPLMAGVVDLLDRLEKKGVPKAIGTSSTWHHVETVLAPHGILERFAFVLTCDDVTLGKPHPEIYQKAAARMGHAPEAVVVIEDSVNGVRAAKAAGTRCIAVPHERVRRDGVAAADLVVPHLEDQGVAQVLGL